MALSNFVCFNGPNLSPSKGAPIGFPGSSTFQTALQKTIGKASYETICQLLSRTAYPAKYNHFLTQASHGVFFHRPHFTAHQTFHARFSDSMLASQQDHHQQRHTHTESSPPSSLSPSSSWFAVIRMRCSQCARYGARCGARYGARCGTRNDGLDL